MSRKRTTISVDEVLAIANKHLALNASPDIFNDDWRKGIAHLLESILCATGNYKGFSYNEWLNGGYERWVADGEPGFPEKYNYIGNETKRTYF